MMQKRIGWWLLVLSTLAAPTLGHAQDTWRSTPGDKAPPAAAVSTGAVSAGATGGSARLGFPSPERQGESPPPTAAPFTLPYVVRAQDSGESFFVPQTEFVGPLSHPRYEDGGIFAGTEFMFWRQTRPILSQSVAFRGFLDTNGGITGAVGQFVGSGAEALNTNMVSGPGNYQPGMNVFVGYRFKNGVSVDVEWLHLAESRYAASAGILPLNLNLGNLLENTFLFSPVVNFPINYAGNPINVVVNGNGAQGSTFGIWNAASEMTIQFMQRFEQVSINARIPVWETETYRAYGLLSPRAVIMWEKFSWLTVDRDALGATTNDSTANYTNIVSNRLYGVNVGSGHDWYCGNTPIGAFSIDLVLDAGLYLDFVKGRASYELGDKSTAAHRNLNTYSLVPGLDGKLGLMWYPWEAIQVRLGYSFMALFNTYASPRPIDFNFGTINPGYDNGHNRLLHGFDIGIAFVF